MNKQFLSNFTFLNIMMTKKNKKIFSLKKQKKCKFSEEKIKKLFFRFKKKI